MDPEKQREIASKGGKAAHQKGTAHEFTTEEARVAGRKGGAASRARRSQAADSTPAPSRGDQNGNEQNDQVREPSESASENRSTSDNSSEE